MGDIADLYDWGDSSLWEDDWEEMLADNLSKCQWQTKDGHIIKIRQMKTSHIENCIAFIQCKELHIEYATFSDYIDAFNQELERRDNDVKRIR